MYCSGCGTKIQPELNYCNRCGNPVGKSNADSVAENLSQAVGYVGGFGLIAYIFVMLVMVKSSVNTQALILISLFYLSTLFGICFLLIRQTEMFTKKKALERAADTNDPPPAYLRPVTTSQLQEPAEPGNSVTEHTTKTLDEVLVERK